MTDTEIIVALVLGPAGAFALVRHIVSEWRASRREIFEMRLMAEASFEQQARRDRRKRSESSMPPTTMRVRASVPTGEFDDKPTTDIHEIREEKRRELSSPGLRKPTRGSHHDKER